MVSYLGDENRILAEIASNAIDNVGPICPCIFCRESYPLFLQQVKADRPTRLTRLVYDLHNKVSAKLAAQQWSELQRVHGLAIPFDSVRTYIIKAPTYDTFLKRLILQDTEPVNGHDVALLIAAFAGRVTAATQWNFLLFASSVSVALGVIQNARLQELSALLTDACRVYRANGMSGGKLFADAYVRFTRTSHEVLEKKLYLMRAGVCAAGTCV